MNELQALRKLRASTPSSDESLSALRHDLLRETRATRWGLRVRRPAWRLAVAGALAVGLLAAGTIVHRGDPTSPGMFLERAAAAVESQANGQLTGTSPERPRDDQWIYQRTLWDIERGSAYGMDMFYLPAGAPGELEDWLRFDGRGWWEGKDGKTAEVQGLKPDFGRQANQAYVWDTWQELPRDPRVLLQETYKMVDVQKSLMLTDWWAPHIGVFDDPRKRDQAAMTAISQVLAMGRGLTAPKEVQATLYRALALIPDLELIEGVKDTAGRDAIGVTVTVDSTTKVIVLLDPVSYDYLGWGSKVDDGKVTGGVVLLEAKVVDKPGDR